MFGLTVGLLIENRFMWIGIPFVLIRPERLFYVHLKSSTRYPPTQTLFGSISFPEYVPHPSLEQLFRNTMCLIDYFYEKQLPEHDALFYIKKKGTYKSDTGWFSLYANDYTSVVLTRFRSGYTNVHVASITRAKASKYYHVELVPLEKVAVPKSVSIVTFEKPKRHKQVVKKNPLFDEFGIHDQPVLDLLSSYGVHPLLDVEEEIDSMECVLDNASLSEAEYLRKAASGVKDYEPTRILANTLLDYLYAKHVLSFRVINLFLTLVV